MTEFLAQTGVLGTRVSGATTGGGGTSALGPMVTLQMFAALGIVWALLKFALPKIATKMNRGINPGIGSTIKIEESATFAGGNLYVVSVREKVLLLSVSGTGVSCLADLGQKPEPVRQPDFSEVLLTAKPLEPLAVVETPQPTVTATQPSPEKVREALDRLGRLSQ